MTKGQRAAHRFIWMVVAPVVGAALVILMVARPADPPASLPAPSAGVRP